MRFGLLLFFCLSFANGADKGKSDPASQAYSNLVDENFSKPYEAAKIIIYDAVLKKYEKLSIKNASDPALPPDGPYIDFNDLASRENREKEERRRFEIGVTTELSRALEKYDNAVKTAQKPGSEESAAATYSKLAVDVGLSVIESPIPGSNSIVNGSKVIAGHIIKKGIDFVQEHNERNSQLQNRRNIFAQSEQGKKTARTFGENLYSLYMAENPAATAIGDFLATDLQATPKTSLRKNIEDARSKLANEIERTHSQSVPEAQGVLAALDAVLSKKEITTEDQKRILETQAALIMRVNQKKLEELSKKKKAQIAAKNEEEKNSTADLKLEASLKLGNVLTPYISAVDPVTGDNFGRFFNGMSKAYNTIKSSNFDSAMKGESSTLMGLNIVTLFLDVLSSAIFGGDNTKKQLEAIQKQISILSSEMHERFDRVDQQLGEMFKFLIGTHREVIDRLEDVRQKLSRMEGKIDKNQETLLKLGQAIENQAKPSEFSSNQEALSLCLNHKRLMGKNTGAERNGKGLSEERFTQCLSLLFNCVTDWSTRHVAEMDAKSYLKLNNRNTQVGSENLSRYLEDMRKTIAPDLSSVGDPALIFSCASKWTALMGEYPEYVNEERAAQADLMISYVNHLEKHQQNVSARGIMKTQENENGILFEQYKQKRTDFLQKLAAERKKHLKELNGYGPNNGSRIDFSQNVHPLHHQDKIEHCPELKDTKQLTSETINLPDKDMKNVSSRPSIPNFPELPIDLGGKEKILNLLPFTVQQVLKRGLIDPDALSLCYDEFYWKPTRSEPADTFKPGEFGDNENLYHLENTRYYGKPVVRLRIRVKLDEKKPAVSHFADVVGTEEVIYKVEGKWVHSLNLFGPTRLQFAPSKPEPLKTYSNGNYWPDKPHGPDRNESRLVSSLVYQWNHKGTLKDGVIEIPNKVDVDPSYNGREIIDGQVQLKWSFGYVPEGRSFDGKQYYVTPHDREWYKNQRKLEVEKAGEMMHFGIPAQVKKLQSQVVLSIKSGDLEDAALDLDTARVRLDASLKGGFGNTLKENSTLQRLLNGSAGMTDSNKLLLGLLSNPLKKITLVENPEKRGIYDFLIPERFFELPYAEKDLEGCAKGTNQFAELFVKSEKKLKAMEKTYMEMISNSVKKLQIRKNPKLSEVTSEELLEIERIETLGTWFTPMVIAELSEANEEILASCLSMLNEKKSEPSALYGDTRTILELYKRLGSAPELQNVASESKFDSRGKPILENH